jgi:ribosomal protein S24E
MTHLSILLLILSSHPQVIDIIHPGRANVSKSELQEKLAEV